MKRLLALATLLAMAACSAAESPDATTGDQDFTATDSADGVLFALDNVKAIELTLAAEDVAKLSEQANGVAAQRISPFDARPKAKGTFAYKGPAVPVTPTCDVTKTYDVTVKIKGMASTQGFDHKPSLRIDFDKSFCGLKNVTLNNMVQDNTLLNEALAYKMYASMGVPVPRHGYSQVAVNGQALGVYLTLETIDKNFLKRNFDDASGPMYEGTYGGDLRASDIGSAKLVYTGSDGMPEATDPKLLRAFIDAVSAPGDGVFYGATAMVDTNAFLSMMATAYVIGDWDNYITANNYRMYRSPKTNLWSFIPTGTDQTFNAKLHPFRGFLGRGQSFSILFEKCIGSARCLADYTHRLETALTKLAEPEGTLKGTAGRRAVLIDVAVHGDQRRPQSDASLTTARAAVNAFIDSRAADIRAAASCMSGDKEIFRGACAGLVLRNATDRRCLDSYGATSNDAAPIASYDCHGKPNQRLLVKAAGGGEFELRFLHSDKCVDVPAPEEGVQIHQWSCHGGANQRFTMKPVSGGVQIVAKHTGKCLARGPAIDGGAKVVHVTCSANAGDAGDAGGAGDAGDGGQTWSLNGSLFD